MRSPPRFVLQESHRNARPALLASAATAAMNAVMLDAVLEDGHASAPAPVAEHAALEPQPIRLAA